MEVKTAGDFVELVEQMRATQKNYFKTRSPSALQESKALEKHVDACIKARRERLAGGRQPELTEGV